MILVSGCPSTSPPVCRCPQRCSAGTLPHGTRLLVHAEPDPLRAPGWWSVAAGRPGGVGLAPPAEPRGARPRSLDLHAGLLGNGTLAAASAWSQALLLSKRWVPAALVVPGSRAPGFETLHLGQSPGLPRHVQEMEQKSLVTETTHMLGRTKRLCLRSKASSQRPNYGQLPHPQGGVAPAWAAQARALGGSAGRSEGGGILFPTLQGYPSGSPWLQAC